MPELLLKILHTAGIDYCCILAEVLDGDDGPQFGTPAPTSWSQLLLGLGAPAGAESRCHQLVPSKGRREWEHRVGKRGNGGVCSMGHWGPHVFQDVRGHWEGQISKVFQRYLKVWASFRRNGRLGRYWGSHFFRDVRGRWECQVPLVFQKYF